MQLSIALQRRAAWPVMFVAALALGLTACPAPDQGGAASTNKTEPQAASDEAGLIAAHKELIQAYEKADPEQIAALLDPTRRLHIFHPFLENRFDGIEHAKEGLGRMMARLGETSWTEVHPSVMTEGNLGWITSQVLIKSANLDEPFVGRGTEIWIKYDDGWRLIHGHWSINGELASLGR